MMPAQGFSEKTLHISMARVFFVAGELFVLNIVLKNTIRYHSYTFNDGIFKFGIQFSKFFKFGI